MESKIVEISKSQEEYIVINNNEDLAILPNTSVNLLLKGNNLNVNINVAKNSFASILVFDCSNLSLNITSDGEVKLVEIVLADTASSLKVMLNSENAEFNAKCLAIGKGYNQSFSQFVSHNAKATASNISNYGVAMDKAQVVFETIGKICKGMSKSKCVQLSHGMIMDDDSKVTSKPILLIDEYDVVANHGAAIGKMSDEVMFYLMSRGLSKSEAFMLYLDGVIAPFVAEIKNQSIKDSVLEKLNKLIER